jgi:hypothetical protein
MTPPKKQNTKAAKAHELTRPLFFLKNSKSIFCIPYTAQSMAEWLYKARQTPASQMLGKPIP